MPNDDLYREMREALKDVRMIMRKHDCPRKGFLGQVRYCATCKLREYIKDLLRRSRER